MHNEIQVFTNEKFNSVRTAVIDDKPWFVGWDFPFWHMGEKSVDIELIIIEKPLFEPSSF